jgi:multicomponent Na+:H+ antiporter subunit A
MLTAVMIASLAAAAAAPWLVGRARALLALVPAGLAVALLAAAAPAIARGDALVERYRWAPSLGAELALRCDGLALTFALLITVVGALIVVYADRYLAHDPQRPRFFAILLAFMTAMLGVVLADDLLAL